MPSGAMESSAAARLLWNPYRPRWCGRKARGGKANRPGDPRETITVATPLPPDLPAPEDDGATDHLPGAKVPAVALTSTDGATVRLGQLGAGRTVLYVYPLTGRADVELPEDWDSIPGARGCTNQACNFRDHHVDLLAAGATAVYGLSTQASDYQAEVVERLRLRPSSTADPSSSRSPSPAGRRLRFGKPAVNGIGTKVLWEHSCSRVPCSRRTVAGTARTRSSTSSRRQGLSCSPGSPRR